MANVTTSRVSAPSIRLIWLKQGTSLIWLVVLTCSLIACSKTGQPGSGPTKKLKISVGEIKEITLAGRGDGKSELIGTSDNQEVVDVSRQQLAPAVDTLKHDGAGPMIFQIKGITIGTANVVFAKKPLGGTGAGDVMQTYVVQVVAK